MDEHAEYLRNARILEVSADRDELERAAISLVESGDPDARAALSEFLVEPEFLARLDDAADLSMKTRHVGIIIRALANRPDEETAGICLMLGRDHRFLADPDRKTFLLPTLAAVRPMSEEAARFFREANEEGYYSTVAPLLAMNSSPNALALFEEMIRDGGVGVETRVDALHTSVLSRRTEVPILMACGRLLDSGLEADVADGVIETLYDFRSKEWFGPAIGAPEPPPWESATDEGLDLLLRLADAAGSRGGIPASLDDAVTQSVQAIQSILDGRRRDA